MRNRRTTCAAIAVTALGLGAQSAIAAPVSITALTDSKTLMEVSATKPNKVLSRTTIRGLQPNETLVGIDRRPNGGALYGVITAPMTQAKVARIANGTITDVMPLFVVTGTPPVPTGDLVFLSGTAWDIDFNPTVDRLRLVSNAGQNLRINVANGATFVDGALNQPGATPEVVGAAYTNNDNDAVVPAGTPVPAGFTGTQLFDIDTATDGVSLQNPPNAGTLVPIGPLGFPAGDPVGFDVFSDVGVNATDGTKLSAVTNTAYASFAEAGGTEKLYTVDLGTGAATPVGPFGRKDVVDIAVPVDTTP